MFNRILSRILNRHSGLSKWEPKFLNTESFGQRNKQFYEDLLQSHELDPSIKVLDKVVMPAIPSHTNPVFKINHVEVSGTYDNMKEFKRNFVTKELPKSEQMDLYRSELAFANEVAAFNVIVPYLKLSGITLPVPTCIYANPQVIILEDMLAKGYDLIDKSIKGTTLKQSILVVLAMAKIHAASIVYQQKNPHEFRLFSRPSREILYYDTDSELFIHQSNFLINLSKVIEAQPVSAENKKIIKTLQYLAENSKELVRRLLFDPRYPSVICHGNLLAKKIYIKGEEVILSDLTQIRYHSPASDLSYFLYTNLDPLERMENMHVILETYIKAVQTYSKEKGVNVSSTYTYEWLQAEMKRFTVYGATYALWITPTFYSQENEKLTLSEMIDPKVEKFGADCIERSKQIVLSCCDDIDF